MPASAAALQPIFYIDFAPTQSGLGRSLQMVNCVKRNAQLPVTFGPAAIRDTTNGRSNQSSLSFQHGLHCRIGCSLNKRPYSILERTTDGTDGITPLLFATPRQQTIHPLLLLPLIE